MGTFLSYLPPKDQTTSYLREGEAALLLCVWKCLRWYVWHDLILEFFSIWMYLLKNLHLALWFKGLKQFASWGGRTAPSQSGVCLSFPDPDVQVINGTHADKLKSLPVLPAMEASEISPPSLFLLLFLCWELRLQEKHLVWQYLLKKRDNEQIIFCHPSEHYIIKCHFLWNFLHVNRSSEKKVCLLLYDL